MFPTIESIVSVRAGTPEYAGYAAYSGFPTLEGAMYNSYRVEYEARNGLWESAVFTDFAKAMEFYDSCRKADFLGFVKYDGFYFISSK